MHGQNSHVTSVAVIRVTKERTAGDKACSAPRLALPDSDLHVEGNAAWRKPSHCCPPVSNTRIQILLDASSKTQTQTCFVEETVCWRGAKDTRPPPRHGTWDGRGRSHSGRWGGLGASTCLDSLHFLFLLLCLLALFLQSDFLRHQDHQQLLAPIFPFCHKRQKGLIFLISSWKIPENCSGWAWITYLPPKLIPVAGNGAETLWLAAVFSRTISVARYIESSKNMPAPTFTHVVWVGGSCSPMKWSVVLLGTQRTNMRTLSTLRNGTMEIVLL